MTVPCTARWSPANRVWSSPGSSAYSAPGMCSARYRPSGPAQHGRPGGGSPGPARAGRPAAGGHRWLPPTGTAPRPNRESKCAAPSGPPTPGTGRCPASTAPGRRKPRPSPTCARCCWPTHRPGPGPPQNRTRPAGSASRTRPPGPAPGRGRGNWRRSRPRPGSRTSPRTTPPARHHKRPGPPRYPGLGPQAQGARPPASDPTVPRPAGQTGPPGRTPRTGSRNAPGLVPPRPAQAG